MIGKTCRSTRAERRRALPIIGLSLLAAAALAACSALPALNLQDTLARIAATPVIFADQATPTAAPPTVSTAALVKDRSVLRVGIRFDAPPLASVDDSGELVGFDVDMAREMARRWLGSTRNAVFTQVTSSSAPRRIQNREVDLALGGLVHTQAAEMAADFSLTYLEDGEALLVRTGAYPDFPSLAQRSIAYIDLASTDALARAEMAARITVTLQAAPSYAAAYDALRQGQVEGVVGRWRRLRAEATRDPTLAVLAVLDTQPVGVMLPQNDSDWSDLVNVTLSSMIGDGFYAATYIKWFGTAPAPVLALPGAVDVQLATLPDTVTLHQVLERVQASNTVRIGFNAQSDPLATVDANGDAIGYEVELCRELARRWFQDAGAAVFLALPPGQAGAALHEDTVDMVIGDFAQTGSNERQADFSLPVYFTGISVAVLKSPGAADLAALNGKRVGLVQETTDVAALAQAKQARGVSFTDVPFPDLASALAALRGNQVDGVAAERVTLLALARAADDIAVLPDRLNAVPIGIGMAVNDAAWRNLINLTLQQMVADGAFARIYAGWFGDEPLPVETWPGDGAINIALIAPTATPLPTPTPLISVPDTPTPAPPPEPSPTAPPP